MKAFLKNLLALTGLLSIVVSVVSLVYLDRKLHEMGNGCGYGPARHLEYLSRLLHSCNRSVDITANEMYRHVCDEESRRYDELMDERERNWKAVRRDVSEIG